jgi:autonomous glycyl radical cofactor GrcA
LRGLLNSSGIEISVAAKTKLLNSCEKDNLVTSTMIAASVTPNFEGGYVLTVNDIVNKVPEIDESEYTAIAADVDSSLSISTSSLLNQNIEEEEDEEWIVVDPSKAVKEKEDEKTGFYTFSCGF